MKPDQVKTRLQRQLDDMRARREQAKKATTCDHVFQTIEDHLNIDNIKFKKSDAWFVYHQCTKCPTKLLIDYKME